MLTEYDELLIHQHSRPFSEVVSTDVSWDDGCFYSIWNAEHAVYLNVGMRVNPNTDMLGGWVMLVVGGDQYTIRLSRVWRPKCTLRIGPLSITFVEPFRTVRLRLERNDSPLAFDFKWCGVAPPFEEEHHVVRWRGRTIIDQSRYVQVGAPSGSLEINGKAVPIEPDLWGGAHDHSWGLYQGRRPIANHTEFLPPGPPPSGRALRFWTMFKLDSYSGFFGLHEDRHGVSRDFEYDFLGKGFEGAIDRGWSGERIELATARHQLDFRPGTRMLTGGKVVVTDVAGQEWIQEFEVVTLPFLFAPLPYYVGSWCDGGTMQTYHGEGDVMEWERIDISGMPMDFTRKDGTVQKNAHGHIYGTRVKMTDPAGAVSEGLQHITFWVEGDYEPYGFRGAAYP